MKKRGGNKIIYGSLGVVITILLIIIIILNVKISKGPDRELIKNKTKEMVSECSNLFQKTNLSERDLEIIIKKLTDRFDSNYRSRV